MPSVLRPDQITVPWAVPFIHGLNAQHYSHHVNCRKSVATVLLLSTRQHVPCRTSGPTRTTTARARSLTPAAAAARCAFWTLVGTGSSGRRTKRSSSRARARAGRGLAQRACAAYGLRGSVSEALSSCEKWKVFGTVALLFVCNKYYPIMD